MTTPPGGRHVLTVDLNRVRLAEIDAVLHRGSRDGMAHRCIVLMTATGHPVTLIGGTRGGKRGYPD